MTNILYYLLTQNINRLLYSVSSHENTVNTWMASLETLKAAWQTAKTLKLGKQTVPKSEPVVPMPGHTLESPGSSPHPGPITSESLRTRPMNLYSLKEAQASVPFKSNSGDSYVKREYKPKTC